MVHVNNFGYCLFTDKKLGLVKTSKRVVIDDTNRDLRGKIATGMLYLPKEYIGRYVRVRVELVPIGEEV